MWPEEVPTGSWIDCLEAIEKRVVALKGILGDRFQGNEFKEKLLNYELRDKFNDIWRYAGNALKDLDRQ